MSELKNIPCAVRGFHYYRRYWTPYLGEELICQHDDSNPFDVFAIKTCSQENSGTYGHLPREISRATKFLIDRGALMFVEVSSNHYRHPPLVQGGLEIPCRLSVKLAVAIIKNNMLVDRYKQILEELIEEPSEEMGSILLDDFEEVSDIEDETNVGETAMPCPKTEKENLIKQTKKQAKCQTNNLTSQVAAEEMTQELFSRPCQRKKLKRNRLRKRKNLVLLLSNSLADNVKTPVDSR